MNIPPQLRHRNHTDHFQGGELYKKNPFQMRCLLTCVSILGRQNIHDFYNIGIFFVIFTPILFFNILAMYAYFQCCAFNLFECKASSLRDHPVIEFLIPRDNTFYNKDSILVIGATIFLVCFEYRITGIWHEMGHILSGLSDHYKLTKVEFNWVQPHVTVREDHISTHSSKLRIASAGVFHNILMAVTCLFMYHVVRLVSAPWKDNPWVFLWRSGFYNYYYLNGGFILNGLPLEQFDGSIFWRRLLAYLNLTPVDHYFNLTYLLLYVFVTSIQIALVVLMMSLADYIMQV